MTLGQKIRHFRKRAGYSQMQLELDIEASHGSISRIESDKVNPTKETIVDIAKTLELETIEIASLFGINLLNHNHLFEETTEILSSHNLEKVLDRTVNNLIFKMGYLASMIMLVNSDKDKVNFNALTNSNISAKTIQCLDKPLDLLYLSLERDLSNLTVKAINENKTYLTHYTYEYTVPAVTKEIADKIQEVTGDKSNLIVPLCTDGKSFGAIVYVKKIHSDFKDEKETLKVISKQIAVAIQNARKFEFLKTIA